MDTIQHFFELINPHKNIFIAISDNPSGDAFFSALALKEFIKIARPDIKIEIVCKNLGNFAQSKFKNDVLQEIKLSKKWEFELDTTSSKVHSVKYEKTDNVLRVIFIPENPKSQPGKYVFSNLTEDFLVIALEIKEKNSLKNLFGNENPDGVSIININGPENGDKNCILNISKEQTPISHIIYQLFNNDINNKKTDRDILNLLFSAFISATNQFKDPVLTNSKLLKAASLLLEKGAQLEKAFSNLDLLAKSEKTSERQEDNPKEISEVCSWT